MNIPIEFNLTENDIDVAIKDALKLAEINNVRGKEITPFLLSKISEITKGRSLDTSILFAINIFTGFLKLLSDLARALTITGSQLKVTRVFSRLNQFSLTQFLNSLP